MGTKDYSYDESIDMELDFAVDNLTNELDQQSEALDGLMKEIAERVEQERVESEKESMWEQYDLERELESDGVDERGQEAPSDVATETSVDACSDSGDG